MMLSDASIVEMLAKGYLVIEPKPLDRQLQPASVDLTLGDEMLSPYENRPTRLKDFYTVLPGECVLGATREYIEIPTDLVGRVEGKSSLGRTFLMVHSTAGFIDPGFRGRLTLELVNLSRVPIVLTAGQPIAQISFTMTDQQVARPYGSPGLGSRYQDQSGVTAAR